MSERPIPLGLVTALKLLLLAAAALFLVTQLLGARRSAAPFGTVADAVCGAADLAVMDEGDNQMLRRLYRLEPEAYPEHLLYCPASNMSVEELLLLRLPEGADADAVRAALEERVASQIAAYEGYGPEQVALLKAAAVEVRGGYALLVVGAEPEAVRRAFLGAL